MSKIALPYMVANQEESVSDSKEGSNSNLYDEEELGKVRDVQRRLSLIAFEERENKLQRAENKIAKSKVARAAPAKSSRSEVKNLLKKEIMTKNPDEVDSLVDSDKRGRFEKALVSGKAASKDSKPVSISTRSAIKDTVLGTQASGVMQFSLGEDMKAKINRVTAVAAQSNKLVPVKKARAGIVGNLMRSLSRDMLQDDIAMTPLVTQAPMAKSAEPIAPKSNSRSAPPLNTSVSTVEARLRAAGGETHSNANTSSAPASKPLAKRRQSVRTMLV